MLEIQKVSGFGFERARHDQQNIRASCWRSIAPRLVRLRAHPVPRPRRDRNLPACVRSWPILGAGRNRAPGMAGGSGDTRARHASRVVANEHYQRISTDAPGRRRIPREPRAILCRRQSVRRRTTHRSWPHGEHYLSAATGAQRKCGFMGRRNSARARAKAQRCRRVNARANEKADGDRRRDQGVGRGVGCRVRSRHHAARKRGPRP